MQTKNTRAWIAVATSLAGLGCASTQVRTDHAADANFSPYRTYAVQEGQVYNQGISDKRDTLIRGRIDTALNQNLVEKGLQPVAQNPDVIVTYTARQWMEYYVSPYWDWYANPTWDAEIRHGSLVIDLIDADTKKLVWRSVVYGENKNFRSAKTIEKAIDKAFKQYPPARSS